MLDTSSLRFGQPILFRGVYLASGSTNRSPSTYNSSYPQQRIPNHTNQLSLATFFRQTGQQKSRRSQACAAMPLRLGIPPTASPKERPPKRGAPPVITPHRDLSAAPLIPDLHLENGLAGHSVWCSNSYTFIHIAISTKSLSVIFLKAHDPGRSIALKPTCKPRNDAIDGKISKKLALAPGTPSASHS